MTNSSNNWFERVMNMWEMVARNLLIQKLHASGHASGEDTTWAIEQIDPDYIVPIHMEVRDWFAERFDNVVLVEE